MATINDPRHQIIKSAFTPGPETVRAPELSLHLWERLAVELVSIIGEIGFESLYSRSLHRTSTTFPWLALCSQQSHTPQPEGSRFSELTVILAGQTPAAASEASIALLITFTDILAALVGEHLTTIILQSAWGDAGFNLAEKAKE